MFIPEVENTDRAKKFSNGPLAHKTSTTKALTKNS